MKTFEALSDAEQSAAIVYFSKKTVELHTERIISGNFDLLPPELRFRALGLKRSWERNPLIDRCSNCAMEFADFFQEIVREAIVRAFYTERHEVFLDIDCHLAPIMKYMENKNAN